MIGIVTHLIKGRETTIRKRNDAIVTMATIRSKKARRSTRNLRSLLRREKSLCRRRKLVPRKRLRHLFRRRYHAVGSGRGLSTPTLSLIYYHQKILTLKLTPRIGANIAVLDSLVISRKDRGAQELFAQFTTSNGIKSTRLIFLSTQNYPKNLSSQRI